MNSGNIEATAITLSGIENALDIVLESANREITALEEIFNERGVYFGALKSHLNALGALSMGLHNSIEEINTEVNNATAKRART